MEKVLDVRNDLSTDANRFTNGVSKLVTCCFDDLSIHLIRKATIVSQCLSDFIDVVVQSDSVRLSIIPCFDRSEDLFVFFDKCSKAAEQFTALGTWEISP